MGVRNTDDLNSIADLARRVRKQALMMTSRANASHIGSSLSSVDVMAMLYGKVMRYDSYWDRAEAMKAAGLAER